MKPFVLLMLLLVTLRIILVASMAEVTCVVWLGLVLMSLNFEHPAQRTIAGRMMRMYRFIC